MDYAFFLDDPLCVPGEQLPEIRAGLLSVLVVAFLIGCFDIALYQPQGTLKLHLPVEELLIYDPHLIWMLMGQIAMLGRMVACDVAGSFQPLATFASGSTALFAR